MRPVNSFFDIGDRPKQLQKDLDALDRLLLACVCDSQRLNLMTTYQFEVVKTVVLDVQIGKRLVRIMFGIVRYFAVPVLLSMSFIDEIMKGTFSSEIIIVPLNCPTMPILFLHETKTDKIEEQQEDTVPNTKSEEEFDQELVRVARTVTSKPLCNTSILVVKTQMALYSLIPLHHSVEGTGGKFPVSS